jgi:hypothetical protein
MHVCDDWTAVMGSVQIWRSPHVLLFLKSKNNGSSCTPLLSVAQFKLPKLEQTPNLMKSLLHVRILLIRWSTSSGSKWTAISLNPFPTGAFEFVVEQKLYTWKKRHYTWRKNAQKFDEIWIPFTTCFKHHKHLKCSVLWLAINNYKICFCTNGKNGTFPHH